MTVDSLFVPAITPPTVRDGKAYWLIFSGDKLLTFADANVAPIPLMEDVERLGLTAVRRHYLGYTNGRTHCYVIEVDPETEAPPGMIFRSLRTLLTRAPETHFWLAGRAAQILRWDRNHQFCGRCGLKTEILNGERAKRCPGCGLVQYPHIAPAMIVRVTRTTTMGEEILLARSHRHRPGFYSVLAGFVEPGETLEECVKREIREEVGLEVKDVTYFGSQPWPFPNSLMAAFTAVYASGDIVLEEAEMAEANWYKADALPNIPPPPTISRRLIDDFVNRNRKP